MTSPLSNIVGSPDIAQTASAQIPLGGASATKPSPTVGPAAPVQDVSASATSSTATAQPTGADLRLVIEDDKAAGCFVYKVINRTTGEVVQQAPQEQIVKLREADGYLAGDVIKAQA
ncbi:MAG TPA: hypothetical protein VGI79_14830 [Caulobacteraceae bacterium]|jgi:hypothetical protein